MPRQKGVKEEKPRKNSPSSTEAVRRISERGFEAVEPFPGNTETDWLVSCLSCHRQKTVKLKKWRTLGCRYCVRGPSHAEIEELIGQAALELLGTPESTAKAAVRCLQCGEESVIDLGRARRTGEASCIYCRGWKLSPKQILTRISEANLELIGPPPASSADRFLVRCGICGLETHKTLANLRKGYKNCQYCARNSVIQEDEARKLYLSVGLEPLGPFPGGKGGWKSKCTKCGEIVSPHYTSVTKGRGCKFCSGKAVNPEYAARVMRSSQYQPLVPYPGALKKWKSKCTKCGKESAPTFATVSSKGSMCKFCNPAGINLTEPAVFYLIEHKDFRALKIGISGAGKNRITSHKRQGWQLLELLHFETGEEALELEQSVKKWIRQSLGLPQYLGKEEMPQRGETETFSADEVDPKTVWKMVLSISESLAPDR
jgi:formylmethanofuran dehydrogenase subunit E